MRCFELGLSYCGCAMRACNLVTDGGALRSGHLPGGIPHR